MWGASGFPGDGGLSQNFNSRGGGTNGVKLVKTWPGQRSGGAHKECKGQS